MALRRPRRVLTVAGTNGKGSSVLMLEALFLKRGESVGAYTSPHILHYEERIRVGGRPAGDGEIVAAFRAVEAARRDVPLTYFEYGTLAALAVFASNDVDTAVLEVGLGGRLDAVNIVDHDGCIITNVSMDHADWLGDTVGAIAREKAGVMRPGLPAVFGAAAPPDEIREVAAATGADLRVAGDDFSWSIADDGWSWQGRDSRLDGLRPLPLPGRHQLDNASAVLALVESLGLSDLLDAGRVNAAWSALEFAGRQQRLARRQRDWLLDGAHNAAGAASLAAALPGHRAGRRAVLVLGILDDKDAESIVGALAPEVDRIITLTAESGRAVTAEKLAEVVGSVSDVPVTAIAAPADALEAAVAGTSDDDLIVVAGSFYTLEPALRWLGQYRT
jgi:dihydrofolate synthase/folylpolyglutamate synthase